MRYELTDRAKAELREIALFIAVDNPVRAISYVNEMEVFFKKIAYTPHIKQSSGTLDGFEVRKRLFGNYQIYYAWSEGDDMVWIVHIRHAARQSLALDKK